MSEPTESPMMRQYRDLKARDPDAILFFRMGDFYELFGPDAVEAAEILGLTLTSRDKNSENPMAMAGFPHPALDQYLAKIIAAGRRAAVCEQMEDPKLATGAVVKRDIVRVVTPGTLTEDAMQQRNNQPTVPSAADPSSIAKPAGRTSYLKTLVGEDVTSPTKKPRNF